MSKRLSDDDILIWQQITRRIERHKPQDLAPEPIANAKPTPTKNTKDEQPPKIQEFRICEKAKPKTSQPHVSTTPTDRSPNMDKRNFQRLMKGKLEIDATLDLHGMTADQAKLQMIQFISNAYRQGLRLVLVITGKGNRTHRDEFNRERGGVLRQSLPDWVAGSTMTDKVLQVTHAQPKHGGTGAYYVYLRRQR